MTFQKTKRFTKRRKKILKTIALIVIGMLFFSGTFSVMVFSSPFHLSKERNVSTLQYIEHEPIVIENETALQKIASSGDGSRSNPFLISRYNITSNQNALLVIKHTRSYFILENCTLDGISSTHFGIYLYNVSHAILSANIIMHTYRAIYIENSSDVMVLQNTITNNTAAIYSSRSLYAYISQNTISHNFRALTLVTTNMSTVTHNNITKNSYAGIEVDFSHNVTITENTITANRHGIELFFSAENTITRNSIGNSRSYGLRGYSATTNVFTKNVVFYSQKQGMLLDSNSSHNLVEYNDFISNDLENDVRSKAQARDDGKNNTFDHNFWDEIVIVDQNSDKIGDFPYPIDGNAHNEDPFPRLSPLNQSLLAELPRKRTLRSPIIIPTFLLLLLGITGVGSILIAIKLDYIRSFLKSRQLPK